MVKMSNEVDYRLTKILFADMCRKGVIQKKKDQENVRFTMLDRYLPPFGFLDLDEPLQLSDSGFTELMASKLICGKCGRGFGRRPWHSTTYNDMVYECRSKYVKKGFCGNSHIYEETLLDIAKSVAELLIKRRHIVEQFILKTYDSYDPKLLTEVHKYLGHLISEGHIDLPAERDELNYIISEMVVNDGIIEIHLTDGTSEECELPKYTPRRKKR